MTIPTNRIVTQQMLIAPMKDIAKYYRFFQ